MNCIICGNELDEYGFCCCPIKDCKNDLATFNKEVERQKKYLTLPIVDALSKNKMPARFTMTRAAVVALSQLLMKSLRTTEAAGEALINAAEKRKPS